MRGELSSTAPAWPSSTGARTGAINHEEVEVPWPFAIAQKIHPMKIPIIIIHQELGHQTGRERRRHKGQM